MNEAGTSAWVGGAGCADALVLLLTRSTLHSVDCLLAAAEALVPFANDISKLSPAELQPWLARDIGRRKQELVALAWLRCGVSPPRREIEVCFSG